MDPTNRRTFLRNSSLSIAAAGVVAAMPAGAAHALVDAPRPLPDDASVDDAVVAHVRDLRHGEVVLYTGEREVTITDRRLASLLYHATR
jgi:hypothetical protein